jgi:hypothetical protein
MMGESPFGAEDDLQPIGQVAEDLRGLAARVTALVARAQACSEGLDATRRAGEDYARRQLPVMICREALAKAAILLERNLIYLETISVLALTRYLFELLVWLRTIKRDRAMAIEFFIQIFENQDRHIERYSQKLESEALLFDKLGKEDGIPPEVLDLMKQAPDVPAGRIQEMVKSNEERIDLVARRNFSLYGREARWSGYNYAAHFIRKTVLPSAQAEHDSLASARREFEDRIGKDLIDAATLDGKGRRPRWNWRERAVALGMADIYDFIYGYTSRLLHATPVSFFTSKKNLEPREMESFLDHCYVTMLDILDVAEALIEPEPE